MITTHALTVCAAIDLSTLSSPDPGKFLFLSMKVATKDESSKSLI